MANECQWVMNRARWFKRCRQSCKWVTERHQLTYQSFQWLTITMTHSNNKHLLGDVTQHICRQLGIDYSVYYILAHWTEQFCLSVRYKTTKFFYWTQVTAAVLSLLYRRESFENRRPISTPLWRQVWRLTFYRAALCNGGSLAELVTSLVASTNLINVGPG